MSLISGNISFYDNSTNDSSDPNSIIGLPSFLDNSSNQGVITSGLFSGSAFNAGQVSTATFAGNSINSGVVSVAEFVGTASNLGTISDSGSFYGSAVNNGIVGTAIFTGGAINLGTITGSGLFYGTSTNSGVISGNAVFADTTTNNGTVEGNANFATGASNQGGTVNGETGVYTPPSSGNWFNDSSSVARTVTLSGVVTQSNEGSGVVAAEFDGSSGFFSINSFNFDLSQDSTIEFWMKATFNGQNTIIGNLNELNFGIDSSNNLFINDAVTSVNTNTSITQGEWHHIAIVTVSNVKKVYVDGELKITNNQEYDTLTDLKIGYITYGYYSGKIAGLRIVAGTAIYTSNFSVPTSLLTAVTGTQLLLNFGATDVPTAVPWFSDSSSAARAIILNGTVTQSDEGSGVVTAEFGGTEDYITTPNSSDFDLAGDFTIEFFAKLNSSIQQTFISNGAGASHIGLTTGWSIRSDNGDLAFFRYDGTSATYNFNISIPSDGSWHHIAATRSSGVLYLFVDGILGATYSTTVNFSKINSTDALEIGHSRYGSGEHFYLNGKIAALRIVNGVAIYTSSFIPPTSLPTATTETVLLLNFGATDVPTHASLLTSWNGYFHNGDNTTNMSPTTAWSSLYSLDSILQIGTQMYTDGSEDNSSTPNGVVTPINYADNLIVGDTVYHWDNNGIIDNIYDSDPYN